MSKTEPSRAAVQSNPAPQALPSSHSNQQRQKMNHLSLLHHRALHLPRLPPSPRRHGHVQARLPEPAAAASHKHHLTVITMPSQEAESTKKLPLQEPATEEGGRTCALPTWAMIGGVTLGVAAALALSAGAGPAAALGPEGPLVEEFWDNMRRYALYALTVSTGFAYALVEPILELLRNPLTAVLIVVVLAGGGVLVSQVLNAMVGNSDFIYSYEQ